MNNVDIVLNDYELCCAAGTGIENIRQAIKEQRSGLQPNDIPHSGLSTWIGKIPDLDHYPWSEDDATWQSRNNAIIDLLLSTGSISASIHQLKECVENQRIGVVFGSSTSSIDRAEEAYRNRDAEGHLPPAYRQEWVLNPHSPGLYLAHRLELTGPNVTVNTACSSSAKVFASAARWLSLGFVDAVIVGGADSLGLSVLHGFHSLQLISDAPCKPFDGTRDGINLGEAAGIAILTRGDLKLPHKGIKLSGYGESSDAHHMSHPHPEGAGAELALTQALNKANLKPEDIDYINLHGTASRANDNIEGNLVNRLFPTSTFASSTKGWTGHTLGAAGITEALLAVDAIQTGILPGTLNWSVADPEIALNISAQNQLRQPKHVMNNSFGFGGNNACLIFSQMNEMGASQ